MLSRNARPQLKSSDPLAEARPLVIEKCASVIEEPLLAQTNATATEEISLRRHESFFKRYLISPLGKVCSEVAGFFKRLSGRVKREEH
ncbi:MAG: hypothetical protein LBO73_01695 [Holosporaceae bacterium]|nr:hypothetical protein [Holosporaceae bacterium]